MVIEQATDADLPAVEQLLAGHHLPLDGLRDHVGTMIVARENGRIVGSAALEMYADGMLLRSVAVARSVQGRGVGQRLTSTALELARGRGARAVYLLTTTAEAFFPKFGFERIERSAVPGSLQLSIEFQSACPASAVVMQKRLDRA